MIVFGIAGLVLLVACGGLLAGLHRRFVTVTIVGPSMEPAYRDGDRVLVRRVRPARLRAGDVVVVERPDAGGVWPRPPAEGRSLDRYWMIKRVAATPGELVPAAAVPWTPPGGERVPDHALVLLGDNATASYDSREIGYFAFERYLGTVLRPRR